MPRSRFYEQNDNMPAWKEFLAQKHLLIGGMMEQIFPTQEARRGKIARISGILPDGRILIWFEYLEKRHHPLAEWIRDANETLVLWRTSKPQVHPLRVEFNTFGVGVITLYRNGVYPDVVTAAEELPWGELLGLIDS